MSIQDDPIYADTYDSADIQENKTMAGLAYLLFFLPLITNSNSKYGKFHANQGLLLLLFSIIGHILITFFSNILTSISWHLYSVSSLLHGGFSIIILALFIIGLLNGLNGKAKELPLFGSIRIIK